MCVGIPWSLRPLCGIMLRLAELLNWGLFQKGGSTLSWLPLKLRTLNIRSENYWSELGQSTNMFTLSWTRAHNAQVNAEIQMHHLTHWLHISSQVMFFSDGRGLTQSQSSVYDFRWLWISHTYLLDWIIQNSPHLWVNLVLTKPAFSNGTPCECELWKNAV